MTDPKILKSELPGPPGQRLVEARKKMSLTSEDIALKLNLSLDVIRQIETDEFNNHTASVFYRGYLRSYAKFVGLDGDELVMGYNQLIQQDTVSGSFSQPSPSPKISSAQTTSIFQQSLPQSFTTKNSSYRWVIITVSLLAIIIVAVLYYSGASRVLLSSIFEQANENGTEKQTSVEILQSETNEIELNLDEESLLQKPDASSDASSDANLVEDAGSLLATDPGPVLTSNDVYEPADDVIDPVFTQDKEISGDFIVSFTGDCWVKITDATDEVLAIGIKRTGKVMNLTGRPPFKLILGNPGVVNIDFNGSEVDLSVFPQGHSASFTLPLGDQ